MAGKYIYGIVNTDHSAALGISGLGGSGPAYTIAHRGLGCVVSDYSGEDFASLPKGELGRFLLGHQVVVEHVMREHPVLPVKFGTLLATSEEVRQVLSQGWGQFRDALAWIEDKVEVEVAATWDTGQVLQEISREEEIRRFKESLAGRPGPPTYEERLRLGQMAKASLDRRRESHRERMMSLLRPAALDAHPNPLLAEEMVMNVAFLVETARREEFESGMKNLDDLFHNEISFRILGPLPPYSFATVEVARPSPEKIEEARHLLNLGQALSEAEVRRAYRRLAAQTHPDCHPGAELAKARFLELRRASDLLIAFCRGRAESGGSFLISIKRQGDEEVEHFPLAEREIIVGAAGG